MFAKACMRAGEEWPEISIGNVSSGGFMAKFDALPAVGETIEVRHRGLIIFGRVTWVKRRRFGVEASEPIDLEALFAKSDLGAAPSVVPAPPVRNGFGNGGRDDTIRWGADFAAWRPENLRDRRPAVAITL